MCQKNPGQAEPTRYFKHSLQTTSFSLQCRPDDQLAHLQRGSAAFALFSAREEVKCCVHNSYICDNAPAHDAFECLTVPRRVEHHCSDLALCDSPPPNPLSCSKGLKVWSTSSWPRWRTLHSIAEESFQGHRKLAKWIRLRSAKTCRLALK